VSGKGLDLHPALTPPWNDCDCGRDMTSLPSLFLSGYGGRGLRCGLLRQHDGIALLDHGISYLSDVERSRIATQG
jgi:hypothetical protein